MSQTSTFPQPSPEHPEPTTTGSTGSPEPTGGRHPVRVGHLVAGLVFTGLAVVWALLAAGTVDADDLRWLAPLPFLVAGAAGLAVATLPRRGGPDR